MPEQVNTSLPDVIRSYTIKPSNPQILSPYTAKMEARTSIIWDEFPWVPTLPPAKMPLRGISIINDEDKLVDETP